MYQGKMKTKGGRGPRLPGVLWRFRRLAARARRDREALGQTRGRLFDVATDPDVLHHALAVIQHGGGDAAGLDRVRPSSLTASAGGDLARALSKALRGGTYRPWPDRQVEIPKASGNGTRTLSISALQDRVVQRAMLEALQPLLDPLLGDLCLGYRPGLDRRHALLRAEQLARQEGRWVWVTDDVKDAFDNVPRGRLTDVLRSHLGDGRMLDLLHLTVGEGGKGIRQGSPLSPLLLNVYLGSALDRPWQGRMPGVPLVRVADDLLALAGGEAEALGAHDALTGLVTSAGMALKGNREKAVADLARGGTADWLGFRISARTGTTDPPALGVGLTDRAWRGLELSLDDLLEGEYAPLRVVEVIQGWVNQQGPALENLDGETLARRLDGLCEDRLLEGPTGRQIRAWRLNALRAWGHIRVTSLAQEGLVDLNPRGPDKEVTAMS